MRGEPRQGAEIFFNVPRGLRYCGHAHDGDQCLERARQRAGWVWVGSDPVRYGSAQAARVGSGRAGSSQVGSGRAGSGRVRSGNPAAIGVYFSKFCSNNNSNYHFCYFCLRWKHASRDLQLV